MEASHDHLPQLLKRNIMSADFSPNENTLITIRTNSFNAIRTFLESGVTEKIDIMYGELKNIIPCENAIQIKEIKNVTCNADETKNTDYNTNLSVNPLPLLPIPYCLMYISFSN